ncbi:hypothetical protein EVAR_27467_1 [Eumeta japonica]|uniref:Uncharacterized protein n=1 Tax=Eumeta variegata TaxID=151549 RepID=A0A4C1VJE0_EUMVA|nr:hypothetical protein EVAR_27467_1 [Eumeta japonica]
MEKTGIGKNTGIIGKINDLKEAKYYTIMFDFIPDVSRTEQMSQTLEKLTVDDLDIEQCRVANFIIMGPLLPAFIKEFVFIYKLLSAILACARIAERNELTEFVPCLAHSLNLVEVAEALEGVEQTSHAPEAKYEAGHLSTDMKNFKFNLTLTIWVHIFREVNRVNIEI